MSDNPLRPVPVEIKCGELRGSCLPEALPAWLAHGWTLVDDGDSETDSVEAPEKATKKRASAKPSNEEE